MTTGDTTTSQATLFTHNCHIKHVLATLILGNGSHKNLVAQDLVQCFSLPTNSNPSLYPLGWVHKDGPHLLVSKRCVVTFAIGSFHETLVCDVSPLNCAYILLGIPY
jgi:hypothetical protein